MEVTLQQIDEYRVKGLRPQVVGCILNKGKILFAYIKEYDLWQLPQGGIDNGENIEQAFLREMGEELGEKILESFDSKIEIFGEDQILFPSRIHGGRELKTDGGKEVLMKGKKYFFAYVIAKDTDINLEETEFDEIRWTSYADAIELASSITQRNKRNITLHIINTLKERGLLK